MLEHLDDVIMDMPYALVQLASLKERTVPQVKPIFYRILSAKHGVGYVFLKPALDQQNAMLCIQRQR